MALKSNRKAAEAEIARVLSRKNAAAAILATGNVQKRTPVDTGRLRSSIANDSDEGGFVVGTNVEYGVYQELGTRYQRAQPYLVPGLMNSISDLKRIYGE